MSDILKDRDPGDETPQPAEPVTILDFLPEVPVIQDPDDAIGLPLRRVDGDQVVFLSEMLRRTQGAYGASSRRVKTLLELVEKMDRWLIGTTPDDLLDEVDRELGRAPKPSVKPPTKVEIPAGVVCMIGGDCE